MDFIFSWLGMFIGFLIIQVVLCFKIKNNILKFIPPMIIALSYILAMVLYIGGVIGAFPEGGRFAGTFIMLYSSADLLGCLVAWAVYVIYKKIKVKKGK